MNFNFFPCQTVKKLKKTWETMTELKKTWVHNVHHDFAVDAVDGVVRLYDGTALSLAFGCPTFVPTWGMRSDQENRDSWQGLRINPKEHETDVLQVVKVSVADLVITATNIHLLPVTREVMALLWHWFPYVKTVSRVVYWRPSTDKIGSDMVAVLELVCKLVGFHSMLGFN